MSYIRRILNVFASNSTFVCRTQSILILLFALPVTSETINVTSGGDVLADDGVCTLREAVIAANENFPSGFTAGECPAGSAGLDTISLGTPGIYGLSILGSDEDLARTGDLDLTENVTIEGGDADTFIINGGFLDRVFHVVGNGTNATIRDLTIAGGRRGNSGSITDRGGGIYNNGTLTIEDSAIVSNQGGSGGGVFHEGPSLTVTRSTLRNNRANSIRGGGGILNRGDALIVSDSIFEQNAANASGGDGGAIKNDSGSQLLSITDTLFTQNTANNLGGAIEIDLNDEANIVGSTFTGNHSDDGGAVYSAGDITISNTTFNGNTADTQGGGLYSRSGDLFVAHVTFDEGFDIISSAIYLESGVLTTSNTIVAGRCDGLGLVSFGGNIETPGNTCGLTDPTDVFSASLSAVNLAPLKDNGGKTPTQLLSSGSIALEGGVSGQCNFDDQRDVMRPQDFDGSGIGQCDVGAVELMVCAHDDILSLNNDTISDMQIYEACHSIEAGTDFVLDEMADVTLRAGDTVSFGPGFQMLLGARLSVDIDWAFWEEIP